jgi:hypothetical protein
VEEHDVNRVVPSLRDSPLTPYPTRHFRAGLQVVPSLRDCFVAPSTQGFIRNLEDEEMDLRSVMAMSFTGRNNSVP